MSNCITQEYFDEVCIENIELFEDEGLQETIEQLHKQGCSLEHLTQTLPSDTVVRAERQDFIDKLKNTMENEEIEQESLDTLEQRLQSDQMYAHLVLATPQAIHKLVCHQELHRLTTILLNLLLRPTLRQEWDNAHWRNCVEARISDAQAVQDLFILAIAACRHKEDNKRHLVKDSAPLLVLQALPVAPLVVARLVTVLCTFDEFDATATPVQASQECATALDNLMDPLGDLLRQGEHDDEELHVALVQALRSMALCEATVTQMRNLVPYCAQQIQERMSLELYTAYIGWMRNLAASDTVKTEWGTNLQLQHRLVIIADEHKQASALQQHVCGLVAALALRNAAHARSMVQAGLHHTVVAAIQQHKSTQKQGALAIRNMVARSPEELRGPLHEAGAVTALHECNCPDEAFAALRDLGESVQLLHATRDENGNTILQATQQFGQGVASNFRPVLTESK